jgi:hypothetical protein
MFRHGAFALSLLSIVAHCAAQTDVRLPPSIVGGPPKVHYYASTSHFNLACQATGIDITIRWMKDSLLLQCIPGKVICSGTGVVIGINNGAQTDEGNYQCVVSNPHGTAVSNIMVANAEGDSRSYK